MNINKLTQRQKDKFLENILKVAEGSVEEGLSRTASGNPMSGAMLDKAEAAFNATFSGPNGLKRVAFAMSVPLKSRLD